MNNNAYRELYVRWMQFGTFSPMMRSHGTDAPREIYKFGERGTREFDAIEKAIKLRYTLLPYIYSNSWAITNEAGSIMRPLIMDFAADKNTHNLTDQYMFGNSILVAPVVKPMYVDKQDGKGKEDYSNIKDRSVYLPSGAEWYDFETEEKLSGGQTVQRKAPIDYIPLYIKAGTVMPVGPDVQYAEQKKWDNLLLRIYPGADAEFTLYEDENDNYNYEKGAYSTITFKWNDKNRTLSITDRTGSFVGMLKNRSFQLAVVGEKGKSAKTVKYKGKKVSVKL